MGCDKVADGYYMKENNLEFLVMMNPTLDIS